jgi:hypothetical protein
MELFVILNVNKIGGVKMKNYIIFLSSFILLFSLFQVFSGWFLTFTHIPDITDAWNLSDHLPQEVVFVESPLIPTLIFAIFSATIAYFISKKFTKVIKSKK